MQHYNPDDLIDHFLKRKLTDSETEALKKMIASDSQMAETLDESIETYHFLQYLRYQQIKKHLQECDAADHRTRRRLAAGRWVIAAMILCFGLIGSWFVLACSYDPENLAKKNLKPIVFNGVIPADYSESDTLYLHAANNFTAEGDYQNASKLFNHYSQKGSLALIAKWNELICQLAINGPDPWWNTEMIRFIHIPGNPYFSDGEKIFQLVNSSWYKIITRNSSAPIKALKPRLI